MTKVTVLGATLFAATAAAFAFAFYVLGAWLGLGCVASFAYELTANLRADRPDTVAALKAVQEELSQLHERTQQLTLHFTSAFPLQARRRSLMQPPGNQP